MLQGEHFSPGRTQTLTVGSVSEAVPVDADAPLLRVVVLGNEVLFLRCGVGPQIATLNDFPILPNLPQIINKGVGANYVAMIAGSGGTDTVYLTTGG